MESNVDPNEISLLDLLVTAAESWKLLIFGPIAAGLVGLGVAFLLPATYVSTAVLSLPQEGFNNAIAKAVVSSDDFLLGVAQTTGRLDDSNARSKAAEQIRELRSQTKVTSDRKSQLLSIKVTAPTPEQAQALNQQLVDALLVASKPTGSQLQRLQTQLANLEILADGYRTLIERIDRSKSPSDASESIATTMALLANQLPGIEDRILEIKKSIAGLDQSVVIKKSDRPRAPTSPKRSLITVLTALAAALVLLLYVFIRQALRQSAQDPESVRKWQAIKQALLGCRSTSEPG